MRKFIGLTLILIGSASFAIAGAIITVPEIDPATAVGALALLSGGLLVLRARRKK